MTCEEVELELPFELSPVSALHVAQCVRCQLSKRALALAAIPLEYQSVHRVSLTKLFVPVIAVAAAALLFVMLKPLPTPQTVAVPVAAAQLTQDEVPTLDVLDDEVFSEVSWAIDDEDEMTDDEVDLNEAGYEFEI